MVWMIVLAAFIYQAFITNDDVLFHRVLRCLFCLLIRSGESCDSLLVAVQ
jgi:hypothetical protein